MCLNGSIDDPFDVRAESAMAFIGTTKVIDETCCLRGCGVTSNESSYRAGRQPETFRCSFNARRHRSITFDGVTKDGFTLLSFVPNYRINVSKVL